MSTVSSVLLSVKPRVTLTAAPAACLRAFVTASCATLTRASPAAGVSGRGSPWTWTVTWEPSQSAATWSTTATGSSRSTRTARRVSSSPSLTRRRDRTAAPLTSSGPAPGVDETGEGLELHAERAQRVPEHVVHLPSVPVALREHLGPVAFQLGALLRQGELGLLPNPLRSLASGHG